MAAPKFPETLVWCIVLGAASAGCGSRAVSEPATAPRGAPNAPQPPPAEAVDSFAQAPSDTPSSAPAPARLQATSSAEPPSSEADLESARRMLGESEEQLAELGITEEASGRAAPPPPAATAPGAKRTSASAGAKDAAPSPAKSKAESRMAEGGAADAESPPRCQIACKALDSMRRAAGRMCDLVGDGEALCSDARGRLSRSQARVARACPTCSIAR